MTIRERKVEQENDWAGAQPRQQESRDETLPAPWEAEDYGGGG